MLQFVRLVVVRILGLPPGMRLLTASSRMLTRDFTGLDSPSLGIQHAAVLLMVCDKSRVCRLIWWSLVATDTQACGNSLGKTESTIFFI
jgi:hypothetical protein